MCLLIILYEVYNNYILKQMIVNEQKKVFVQMRDVKNKLV